MHNDPLAPHGRCTVASCLQCHYASRFELCFRSYMVSERMVFSSGHDEHSHSSSMVENFSGNLQTQEASDGAMHHCSGGLTMSYMNIMLT